MTRRRISVAMAGLDNHYKFSRVTFRDEDGQITHRVRLDHVDRQSLRKELGKWPRGIPVVMEASFGWQWLSDVLLERGLDPQLCNCYKLKQMRKARGGAHTNRKDADLLSELPLEATDWWCVWLAPPEVRQNREWMRYRADLVAQQTRTKNRIHAIFHRHGIFHEYSDLFGTHGRVFLAELCRDGGGWLTGGALAGLQGHVRLLGHVRRELAIVTRILRKSLDSNPLVERIATLPGFGLVLSHVVVAEVGKLERFASHDQLASYCGLAPMSHDTGIEESPDDPKGRYLSPRANRVLKWAFIEAAHGAVRSGGRWRKMFDRYTHGGQKNRNRGYIKVARELVKVLYAIWRDGRNYSPEPPARPGRARQASRSGTGQL